MPPGAGQAIGCLLLLALAAPAFAQNEDEYYSEARGMRDRWAIDIGWVFASFDTELKIYSKELDLGTTIDLEDDLRFDNSADDSNFRMYFRIRPRHRVGLTWYKFDRSSSAVIEEEIEVGDEIIPIGATAGSEFNLDFYQLVYDWSFIKKGKWEAGLRGGLAYLQSEFGVAGETTEGRQVHEFQQEDFPIPMIGIHFEFAPIRRLFLRAGVTALEVSIGKLDGRIIDAKASLAWFPWRHVGFGLGYNYQNVEVGEDGSRFRWDVDYEWTGLTAGLAFAW
jgi:hypothetical protein